MRQRPPARRCARSAVLDALRCARTAVLCYVRAAVHAVLCYARAGRCPQVPGRQAHLRFGLSRRGVHFLHHIFFFLRCPPLTSLHPPPARSRLHSCIHVLLPSTAMLLGSSASPPVAPCPCALCSGVVLRVLFHPKQLMLVSAGDDAEVRVWDLVTRSCAAGEACTEQEES